MSTKMEQPEDETFSELLAQAEDKSKGNPIARNRLVAIMIVSFMDDFQEATSRLRVLLAELQSEE